MTHPLVSNDLSFDDYQRKASTTAIYPEAGEGTINALSYLGHGLTSEAGEVSGKIKKIMRDSGGEVSEEARQALLKEVGDNLWYLAQIANELGVSLGSLAQANLDKLLDRKDRGVLGGSGDER